VSDQAQLRPLARWLADGRDVKVQQTPGTPGEGEQGALDVLTMLAGSSGLIAAIKILPEFIRSRRSGFTITTTVHGRPFTLDATNVDELLPILERLLDA
jgi:Effector Associated Constant Component 1